MISLDRGDSGFVVRADGKMLFSHDTRKPSLYSGSPGKKATLESYVWKKLPQPAVQEPDARSTNGGQANASSYTLEFPAFPRLTLDHDISIATLRFSGDSALKSGFRIRQNAFEGAFVFGDLEGKRFNLRGSKYSTPWLDTQAKPMGERELSAVVFTEKGEWAAVSDCSATEWRFGKKFADLRCARVPAEIARGFGGSVPAGMEQLTRYRYQDARSRPKLQNTLDDSIPHAASFVAPGTSNLVTKLLGLSFSGSCLPAFSVAGMDAHRSILASLGPVFADIAAWKKEGRSERLVTFVQTVFEMLNPYRQHLGDLWVREGIPLLAHPGLRYPELAAIWRRDDQYMVGPDILVAPHADKPGASLRTLYLPEDDWVHLWTSRQFSGGELAIHAPEDRPAVFYRASSDFAGLFDALRQKATRL